MVGEFFWVQAHSFHALPEGVLGPRRRNSRRASAPEFVGRKDDVAVHGVAGQHVLILGGA